MSTIRPIDFAFIESIVEHFRGRGYVLEFSDQSFSRFFADELNVDIDDPIYAQGGGSKGKRFKSFLQQVDNPTAIRTLRAIWEHREAALDRSNGEDPVRNAQGRFLELVNRLGGGESASGDKPKAAHNWNAVAEFKGELTALASMSPQPRGYAFEVYLQKLFNAFGMKAREAFRIRGEQIDGSFMLDSETYLLEAKWHNELTGAADLHILEGKLSQKAAWARGLFVSYTGFSSDGLFAFGRGKQVVCMDGRDIYEALDRQIPLNELIAEKARRAAETGDVLSRVDDLFKR